MTLLTIESLAVRYRTGSRGDVHAVRDVDLTIAEGETLALVGESGSGKTTTAHAVLRLLAPSAQVTHGRVLVGGADVLRMSPRALRGLRGGVVGLVPQDPGNSLNPVERVGWQIEQVLRIHGAAGRGPARRRQVVELLAEAALPDPERVAAQYPGELSGGMRQRALIALAVAARPRLIIADEPTSALDVTAQQQVLDLLQRRAADFGTAVLLVTHDLGVAADRADRVVVMKDGAVVEHGPVATVLASPAAAFTRTLLASAATVTGPTREAPATTEPERPTLELRSIVKRFRQPRTRTGARWSTALAGVDLSIGRGRTLAIVGESGSGKTTLARIAVRLERETSGDVLLDGVNVTGLTGPGLRDARRNMQIVLQNPYASLQPRFTVERIVTEGLRHYRIGDAPSRRRRAAELLDQVALSRAVLDRLPSELSGGQRQRVAIARALALEPRLLVLDEPVSALDVTVQAQILDLLVRLQDEHRLAYLFITHDLAVARRIAHDVAVMRAGQVVETGPVAEILTRPRTPYTQRLLAAVPGRSLTVDARTPLGDLS